MCSYRKKCRFITKYIISLIRKIKIRLLLSFSKLKIECIYIIVGFIYLPLKISSEFLILKK